MDYLKITFADVSTQDQEILIAQLANHNFLGFEQTDEHLLAYTDDTAGALESVQNLIAAYKHYTELIPAINWNEKWEQSFEPIILGNIVAVRAHFHEFINGVQHQIVITPKMSFGTGHHATTQLMLEQMNDIDFLNKKVFDYGTGTGVLAIYAEKLGAKSIIANDVDPWSKENAIENVERNGCMAIDVRLGGLEIIAEEGFEVILANINLNVLKESMPILVQKLSKPGGVLLLSGILLENKEDILDCINIYTSNYNIFVKINWLCIRLNF